MRFRFYVFTSIVACTLLLMESIVGHSVAHADTPPTGAFEKKGNNGTVSCDDFCGNTGANWGPAGDCVGGRIYEGSRTGLSVGCTQVTGVPNSLACYCKAAPAAPPAGAFEKKGNNGTVSCNDFCGNTLADWGPAGTCVGGRIYEGSRTGLSVGCTQVTGVPNSLACYCRAAPAAPPTGAFEKKGNSGTVSCNDFCGNTLADWGPAGDCVGGRIYEGSRTGLSVGCSEVAGVPNSLACYCTAAPAAPPTGAFEKKGNNGTVSCNDFCGNTLADWGPLGGCVGARIYEGARTGASARCSDVPGLGNALACYCDKTAPPTLRMDTKSISCGTLTVDTATVSCPANSQHASCYCQNCFGVIPGCMEPKCTCESGAVPRPTTTTTTTPPPPPPPPGKTGPATGSTGSCRITSSVTLDVEVYQEDASGGLYELIHRAEPLVKGAILQVRAKGGRIRYKYRYKSESYDTRPSTGAWCHENSLVTIP
jgi:hypothetical protein